MASLLRRNLVCFYCSSRSTQKYTRGIRQWKCNQCDAVNHLDKNGEITYPPVDSLQESSTAVQYAQAIQRPGSPVFASSDSSLFCPTCIKNQHMVTQNLSSYLPATTDPRYAEYEAQYPTYRRRLESQYPQLCARCEPRVKERIRATGYAAKTDHLRRLMQKTKNGGLQPRRRRWDWREAMLWLGGLGWWSSTLLQLIWNLAGLYNGSEPVRFEPASQSVSVSYCVERSLSNLNLDISCSEVLSSWVGQALLVGLLTIWWNGQLKNRLRGSGGKLVGLSDYYKLQAITTSARACAWWILTKQAMKLSPSAIQMIHGFFLVFGVLTAFVSTRTVKLDFTPRFSFHESFPEDLQSSQIDEKGLEDSVSYQSLPSSQLDESFSRKSMFSINSLAPQNNHTEPHSSTYNPPTPPPDMNESDLMDWTPSQEAFVPAPTKNLPHNLPLAQPIPSKPFYTKVPRQPESQNSLLRKPAHQPHFKSAPEETKRGFFKRLTNSAASPSTIGGRYGDEQSQKYPEMARQKFYAQTEVQDTGLESLFDAAFSLGDDPAELRSTSKASSRSQNSVRTRATMARGLGQVGALVVAGMILKLPSYRPSLTSQFQFLSLGISSTVSARSLVYLLRCNSNKLTVAIPAIETAVSVALAMLTISVEEDLVQEAIHLLSAIIISGMLFQETWRFLSGTESPSSQRVKGVPPLPVPSPSKAPEPSLHTERHQPKRNISNTAIKPRPRNRNDALPSLDEQLFQPRSRSLIPASVESSPELNAVSPAPSISSWGSPERTFSRTHYAGATPGRSSNRHKAGASEGFAALRI